MTKVSSLLLDKIQSVTVQSYSILLVISIHLSIQTRATQAPLSLRSGLSLAVMLKLYIKIEKVKGSQPPSLKVEDSLTWNIRRYQYKLQQRSFAYHPPTQISFLYQKAELFAIILMVTNWIVYEDTYQI